MPRKHAPEISTLFVDGRSMLFMLGKLPAGKITGSAIRKRAERLAKKKGFTLHKDEDGQGILFDYNEVLQAQGKIKPLPVSKAA